MEDSAMEDSAKVRLVRCPKCQSTLQEPANYSVYKCGGCGAVLRAKYKHMAAALVGEAVLSASVREKERVLKLMALSSCFLSLHKVCVKHFHLTLNLLKQPLLWRYVGFISSVTGLLCYALSSSFKNLFGEWNLLKIFLYGVASFIICTFVSFANKWQVSSGLMLKAHMGFLVLMVTSVYSFFYDKAVKGKADILGLISCGAFAFMSFSLSRQINLGFEVDMLNFFLGCLTLQLMKINLMFASVGAVFCYALINLRSSLDSQVQIGDVSVTNHVSVEIEAANEQDRRAHQIQAQL